MNKESKSIPQKDDNSSEELKILKHDVNQTVYSLDCVKNIIESSKSSNFYINEEGIILNLNSTASSKLMYKKEELINTKFIKLLKNSSKKKDEDFIQKIKNDEISEYEAILIKKNKEKLNVVLSAWNISNNGTQSYLITATDISKLLSTIKAMEYERNLFRTLMDNIPDRIYFKDVESKFMLINKAQSENFHLNDPSEANGLCDHDFFDKKHADDALKDEQKIISSKKSIVSKIEREKVKSAKREYEWVNTTKVPIVNKKGKVTGVVGITRDVTDLKNAEDKIQKYAKELQYLNTSKDKFISILAHDLKNPFFSLQGYADMLKNKYDEINDDERKEYIGHIIDISKNSYQLLENLLEWARSQTGRIEYCPKILKLNLLVEEVIQLIRPLAEKKQINIHNMFSNSIQVYADSDMLRTVIRNLLTNAIKFTKMKGAIKVYQSSKDHKINITIEDNGTGMDSDIVKNLFRIDSQHHSTGTSNETGTGLGLLICKEFIEINGGNINVESEVNKGSKFSIILPKYN